MYPAGTYAVTVTDADGCDFEAQTIVGEPEELLASTDIPLGVSCNGGSDAAAVVQATGGTPPYQYDWSDDSLDGQDAPTGLGAGTYSVTVIDDHGCEVSRSFQINDPPLLLSDITGEPANCFGAADGSIEVLPSGGTGAYSYVWTGGLDPVANPQGVAAGLYSVTVSDANGCTTIQSFEVTEPEAVLLEVESISDYSGFNVSCAEASDGSATVTASGGTGPYTYVWQDGTEGATIEGLGPGEFLVTVTDAKDCAFEERITLTSPEAVAIQAEVIDIRCHGDQNGMIFVDQASGGAAPYVYSLDGAPFGVSGVFPSLGGGWYELAAEDANGCGWSDSIYLEDPEALELDLGEDVEILYGDSIYISSETNIPLSQIDSFAWTSPGEIGCPTCLDSILVKPEVTTPYSLMIRDENNCIVEDRILVKVKKQRLVYIPTAFSPNDDGANNIFLIYGGRGVVKVHQFLIFDRWGEIVHQAVNFEPNDPDYGWDGTLKGEVMNPGVFVYLAKIEFDDGSVELYTGDVTLTR